MEDTKKNKINIGLAVIVAGVIIAGAILLRGTNTPTEQKDNKEIGTKNSEIKISEIDHITGNADSKIVIVEYSDTECPYCKVFQNTMQKVMAEKGNEVAWVYRHFPIAQLHSKAFKESVATECAFEQGGNEMFWKYIDEVYSRTESNNKLPFDELSKIASDFELNISEFNECLNSDKYDEKVNSSLEEGNRIGVSGTPKSFILKDGKIIDTIDGAYPYEVVIQKIETALK
ncbi:MAG: DsbA family protein [Candidatus Paceibacterota bacterium]